MYILTFRRPVGLASVPEVAISAPLPLGAIAFFHLHDHAAPLGKRRARKKEGSREIVADIWDEHQCALIREIRRRYERGERMRDIAADFERRGEMRVNAKQQKLWTIRSKKTGEIQCANYHRAYWLYLEMLAAAKDLMDAEAKPQEVAQAQRILRRRVERLARRREKKEAPSTPAASALAGSCFGPRPPVQITFLAMHRRASWTP